MVRLNTELFWIPFNSFVESVIIFAPHGIQLETHRGWSPSFVLSSSKRFIPTFTLREFVINEGLRGWNVRYYLVAIQQNNSDDLTLQVAYEVSLHFKPS